MNTVRLYFLSFLVLIAFSLQAQEISYGFKAGLNFNRLQGDSEIGDDGMSLEEFTQKNGFHVGATFSWEITDLMGLRGEFLYSQKGYKRRFDGPSFYLGSADQPVDLDAGNRNMFLSVANSYIDIPIVAYAKVFKWLEVHAGASVGFLVNSTAIGGLTYTLADGSEIQYDYDIRFGSDDVGEFNTSGDPDILLIGGNPYTIPQSVGAYYEYREDEGNYHNFFDVGLVGGLSFYLNRGLYVGARFNYGLTDITNEDADYSYKSLDANGNYITRDDKDKNVSIQASVGFNF